MWAEESVVYQIYTLGFCGAPLENDGVEQPRIKKMLEWSDYLKDLGVDTVLFNPVFESDKHGYDTRDYNKIDVRLGNKEDFAEVCRDLHEHGIKILLDGVFNHVGRGFWAFQDVLKNRESSPYKDWFFVNFYQNNAYNDGLSYEGWEGHYELVKLNLRNPQVVQHLLQAVKGWVEDYDIDGLRLDVAYCLDRDFMKQLRPFAKGLKEDFFLLGEMLFGDYKQIVNGEMLDSATNYECYKGLHSSFNEKNLFEIAHSLNRQFGPEPWTLYKGLHLMNFVDNHDVSRIASNLKNEKHLPLIYAVEFAMNGIPCIYYGSEWGIKGDKRDGDHALRPEFEKPEPNELTELIKKLIAIHKQEKALSYGSHRSACINNQQLVLERSFEGERVYAAVNLSDAAATVRFDAQTNTLLDLMTGETESFSGELNLEAYSFRYLKAQ